MIRDIDNGIININYNKISGQSHKITLYIVFCKKIIIVLQKCYSLHILILNKSRFLCKKIYYNLAEYIFTSVYNFINYNLRDIDRYWSL